jgi:hypothetical protein
VSNSVKLDILQFEFDEHNGEDAGIAIFRFSDWADNNIDIT